MKTLPSVDVVIIGGGWTGLLMAKELGSRTALTVVVLERGGPRRTDDYSDDMDELDYTIRFRMMQDVSQETVTLRHDSSQRALPLRQHGSFLPGSGVGAARNTLRRQPRSPTFPQCSPKPRNLSAIILIRFPQRLPAVPTQIPMAFRAPAALIAATAKPSAA